MRMASHFSCIALVFLAGLCPVLPLLTLRAAEQGMEVATQNSADPWSSGETMLAPELAHEIGILKNSNAPTIIYVGFRTLFEGGHVPGAVFHGTASTEKGLTELKTWLATLPRSTNLVIYCGCCPFDRCPNIRPAYKTSREMGFAHVRVLVLPTSFAKDWVENNYPMAKGL